MSVRPVYVNAYGSGREGTGAVVVAEKECVVGPVGEPTVKVTSTPVGRVGGAAALDMMGGGTGSKHNRSRPHVRRHRRAVKNGSWKANSNAGERLFAAAS